MKIRRLLPLFSVAITFALAGLAAAEPSPQVIDDVALRAKLQKGLENLHEDKKAVPLRELSKQLNRRKATAALSDSLGKSLAPDAFYSACKPSVLVMGRLYKCGKCTKWHVSSASAFALTENGVIATNHHVVENKEGVALAAMNAKGEVFPVKEVLAADKASDVALLRLGLADAKLSPLPLGEPAPVGSPVNVISHPDGRLFTMTKGGVSRYYVARSKAGKADRMAITADYAKGSSGAPVLNPAGEVVGMVSATQSIYYTRTNGRNENLQMVVKSCIPVAAIHRLLQRAD